LKYEYIFPSLQLWDTSISGNFGFDPRQLYTRQKSFTLDPENAGSYQLEIPVSEY